MIDRAAVVLPQPLSPASPRLSPSPRVKSTPSTARTVPSCVWKCVLRPLTVRSGTLPLLAMGRTRSGIRFSERESRTPGTALTFSQSRSGVSASYMGKESFAVDGTRVIFGPTDARAPVLRVPERLVVRDLDPVLGPVDSRPPVHRPRVHLRRRRVLDRAPRLPASRRRHRGPHPSAKDDHRERAVPVGWHPGLRDQRHVLGLRRRERRVVYRSGLLDRDVRISVRGAARGGPRVRVSAVHRPCHDDPAPLECGGFVGVVGDLRLTLLVGALLNLVAVAVAVTFREPKVERTPESTYVEQLVQGLRVVRRREGVALLIGVEVFLGVTLYVMAVFRPLYLQALGLSQSAIAISISGFLLVAAIWSAFAGTITRVLGEFGTLALLVLMASAAFFGMYGAGQFPGSALLQVPLYIVWSLRPALTTAFLNRRLEPGQRATVLSMGAFAYTLGLLVVEPFAGALTTTTGLLKLGLFLGIVTFFPCAYILARWRTTVAAWPAVTPLPSRLIAGHRVSRFHRLLERMSRLRP